MDRIWKALLAALIGVAVLGAFGIVLKLLIDISENGHYLPIRATSGEAWVLSTRTGTVIYLPLNNPHDSTTGRYVRTVTRLEDR